MSDPEEPRFAGSILGVREWITGSVIGHLEPLAMGQRWEEDGPTVARCENGILSLHRAPGRRCDCGLYALHPWALQGELRSHCGFDAHPRTIAGVIEAWGRIELHPTGFRAQYARPVALLAPPRDDLNEHDRFGLERLCHSLGAELIIPEEGGSIAAWLEGRDGILSQSMVESLLPTREWEEERERQLTIERKRRQRAEKFQRVRDSPPGRVVVGFASGIGIAFRALMGFAILGPALAVFFLLMAGFYGTIIYGVLLLIGLDPLGIAEQ